MSGFWDWLKDTVTLRRQIEVLAETIRLLRNDIGMLEADIATLEIENSAKVQEVAVLRDLLASNAPPTYDTFADYIKKHGKEIVLPLNSVQKASLWWAVEKAVWVVFAKPGIQPYSDISPQELRAKVDSVYAGQDTEHPTLTWPEFSDNSYRVTTIANVREIFETSFVGLVPFIAELHDCDDFAKEFVTFLNKFTLNSGMVVYGDSGWGYHAYNLVVCSDGVVMIEPQAAGRSDLAITDYFKVLPEIIKQPGGAWIPRKVRDI